MGIQWLISWTEVLEPMALRRDWKGELRGSFVRKGRCTLARGFVEALGSGVQK